jgi:uncharacterized protein (UPF0212 family)
MTELSIPKIYADIYITEPDSDSRIMKIDLGTKSCPCCGKTLHLEVNVNINASSPRRIRRAGRIRRTAQKELPIQIPGYQGEEIDLGTKTCPICKESFSLKLLPSVVVAPPTEAAEAE